MKAVPAKQRRKFIYTAQIEVKAFSESEAMEEVMDCILTSADVDVFGVELIEEREI